MTPETLLEKLRSGERWRPRSWDKTALLADGHCRVRDRHIFVEYTPKTVGTEVSPAIFGAKDAIRKYGNDWYRVDS